MRSQRGFTLIEIMISLTILAALSVVTAQAMQTAFANRKKFRKEIEREAVVRDTLRVMERDINSAFHYRDHTFEMLKKIDEERKGFKPPNNPNAPPPAPAATSDPSRPANAAAPSERKAPKQYTGFRGEKEILNFTSLSHVRTGKDVYESDQAEIGYFLRQCKHRGRPKESSNCLWRRVSTILDEDIEKGGNEMVLLENVEELTFQYFGVGREEWADSWRSGEDGDAVSKGNFPTAVSIKIRVLNKFEKGDKPLEIAMVAPVRFPNNASAKKDELPKDGSGPSTPPKTPGQ